LLLFIIKRLLQGAFVVLGVILVIFLIIRVIPGDPARLIAAGGATPESIEKIRHELDLDKPKIVQFLDYLAHVVKGDLGQSIFRSKGGSTHHGIHKFVTEAERTKALEYEKAKVLDLIIERLPLTLLLTGLATLFALLIAGSLGILSALKEGTIWDKMATLITIASQALPNFWVGVILIVVVSVKLKLLPAMGYPSGFRTVSFVHSDLVADPSAWSDRSA
jgi:peptide/nickel transport system permease protein